MVPRARMTQRWPLRPWRSQRKLYVVIYRGALRRRMRRLVRSRVFNNPRTATRNLDLPLAMEGPHLTHKPVYCIGGFRPVYGGNTSGLFCFRSELRTCHDETVPRYTGLRGAPNA